MTLPDCMMPDGAEPCVAYSELKEQLKQAQAALLRATPYVTEAISWAETRGFDNASSLAREISAECAAAIKLK